MNLRLQQVRPTATPLGQRALASLFAETLDRRLADGQDPTGDSLLRCRAEQLAEPKLRHRLACDLRHAVDDAERPRRTIAGAAPAAARAELRTRRSRLLELAELCDGTEPVSVRGLAAAGRVLSESTALLWLEGDPQRLDAALADAPRSGGAR